jgi:hypothetical protein
LTEVKDWGKKRRKECERMKEGKLEAWEPEGKDPQEGLVESGRVELKS